MSDKNLIQLAPGDHWHYWNFGSMMPICGAGEPDPVLKNCPRFAKSMHATAHGANRSRNMCPDCVYKAGAK